MHAINSFFGRMQKITNIFIRGEFFMLLEYTSTMIVIDKPFILVESHVYLILMNKQTLFF